jgi:protein-L-isoaspartate(D-aspartate) O-methyltransferase
VSAWAPLTADSIDYAQQRQKLLGEIAELVRETEIYIDRSSLQPRVMQAMAKVPRHAFVPEEYRHYSYENRPLPIGHGQTISQPYIVALMTELLETRPTDKALEVGTGSGYQAAILAQLVDKVYTIEIIDDLAKQATADLARQGYRNVFTRNADGYYGWSEQAPFDVIVVTAASSHIPPPLIQQLKPGGRMVIPVGSRFMTQQLVLVEKDANGKVTTRQVLPVRFVPLTGGHN